jgi:hypothetical protein
MPQGIKRKEVEEDQGRNCFHNEDDADPGLGE